MATARGYGVAANVAPGIMAELAVAAEAAGYRTFWINNPPGQDAMPLVASLEKLTSTIRFGIGVIPVDSIAPDAIVASLQRNGIDQERLTLGVGSSRRPGPLARVRQACEQLRAETSATIVVGALGPKMLKVAGEAADGVLLNWLPPNHVSTSAEIVIEAAKAAGRPRPRIDAYVRCVLGPDNLVRLQTEAERYTAIPSYGAHFERMQVRAIDTAVVGLQPDAIDRGLAAYEGLVDEVILRAIVAEEAVEHYMDLLNAGAPR